MHEQRTMCLEMFLINTIAFFLQALVCYIDTHTHTLTHNIIWKSNPDSLNTIIYCD